MRAFRTIGLVVVLASVAHAAVWTTVYRYDEITPLGIVDPNQTAVYRDVMVGTHLVLIVSSDSDRFWAGTLYTSWDDAAYGVLSARGYGPVWKNYEESCLDAAGRGALVQEYPGMGAGFSLSTGDNFGVPGWDPLAGDWFVLDYYAQSRGSCDVMLYSGIASSQVLVETLSFTHVASRDFNGDHIVDFKDLAILSSRWRTTTDSDPNGPNAKLDLNSDQRIDSQDLAFFSEYWLERTDFVESAADPNEPPLDSQ